MNKDGNGTFFRMLQTMSEMQEEHNQLVHAQWREQGFRFYRAIWVECAEMLDHFGWKWWKKQDPDIDQVKLELVDIWHFAMSELMIKGEIDERLADLMMQPVDRDVDSEAFRICIEKLALDCLNTESVDVHVFKNTMNALGMSYQELFELYIGKNTLNRFRQNNGYKEGLYQKTWSGKEDNEHLIEILSGLDSEPESLAAQLYSALEVRYQSAAL